MEVSALADYVGDRAEAPRWQRWIVRLAAANSRLIDRIIAVPRQWEHDVDVLRDPLERRLLFRAFADDALLTEARRKSMTSVLLWGFLLLWGVAGIVVALAARPALPDFQATYSLFLYGIATSLFLPLPFETLLGAARAELGIGWTTTVASASKVVGAWVVLLMGDKAHGSLQATLRKYPRIQPAWDRLVAVSQRYGYVVVGVIFAIPFMSDTLPLVLLAVMSMRKSIFLAVTFVAVSIRCLLFFFAPDAVRGLIGLIG